MTRRDSLQILKDLLEAIDKGHYLKTDLMENVGLTHAQLQEYTDMALKPGLVEKDEEGKPRITEKGRKFKDGYNSLTELVKF